MPKSLQEIGKCAFENCYSLEQIALNEGLEVIGEEAFIRTRLEHIKIPSTVRIFSKSPFYECNDLKTVELQEGLEEIGAGCFKYAGIEELIIPSSVRHIGRGAFCECGRLRNLVLTPGSVLERVKGGAFSGKNLREMKCNFLRE